MNIYRTEYPTIEHGKLCIRTHGGSIYTIGVAQARRDVRQIEAAKGPLRPSTQARLAVLKAGIALWEARK